jgi:hypothetical protein
MISPKKGYSQSAGFLQKLTCIVHLKKIAFEMLKIIISKAWHNR